MKKSRFSEQQIAFVLRQAEEGTAVAEVCRKAGISEVPSTTGLSLDEARRKC
jgi:putative transposase